MRYVIAYDITDDKKRKKLSSLLDAYGIKVQYSVYEVELSKTKLKKLINQIEEEKLFDKKLDSIRFYNIHQNALANSFELAAKPYPFEVEDMFF